MPKKPSKKASVPTQLMPSRSRHRSSDLIGAAEGGVRLRMADEVAAVAGELGAAVPQLGGDVF